MLADWEQGLLTQQTVSQDLFCFYQLTMCKVHSTWK